MSRCYIVATGESLKGFNLNQLEFFDTIAVNSAAFYVPNVNHVVALDSVFFEKNIAELMNLNTKLHSIEGYSDCAAKTILNTNLWPMGKLMGVDNYPKVSHGYNSGYAAINIGIHLGFTDIRLLGFDCGGDHFYGKYPAHGTGFDHVIGKIQVLKKELPNGVKIRNYSEQSKCRAFERRPLTKWNED